MARILIKNATLIDGTGRPGEKQDVWIEGEKIYRLGDFARVRADTEIDAKGLVVAPGFVDVLNHSDVYLTLFRYPTQESLLYQGITTVVGGMCGSSLAPLVRANVIASIQKWADVRNFSVNWSRFGEFLEAVAELKPAVNFASLVGHSTLRRGLIGDEFRALTEVEMKKMIYLLEDAFAEGAFGFSSGLAYSHAKVAPRDEIVELLKTVKQRGGIYASHIRGEGGELLFALEETVESARTADVPVEISHLKAMGKPFWKLFPRALETIDEARNGGVNVTCNLYPYTSTGSVLYTLLPDWIAEGGRRKLLERLQDPTLRAKAAQEMRKDNPYDYGAVTIAHINADATLVGKTIGEIARNQSRPPEEIIMALLLAAEGRVIAHFETLSERNVKLGLGHEAAHIATDGAGYTLAHEKSRERVHPRSFGAFPRVISRYGKKSLSSPEKKFALETLIAKMTLRPAETFGIKERGQIKAGYRADLVLFHPRTFKDLATFENPYRYAEGVEYLFINGAEVIRKKKYTGARAGQVLRRT